MLERGESSLTDPIVASLARALAEYMQSSFEGVMKAALKRDGGFTSTLKELKRARVNAPLLSVKEGVVEQQPSGLYDAALQTENGRLVLVGGKRTDCESIDPQSVVFDNGTLEGAVANLERITSDHLLAEFKRLGMAASAGLICEIELTRFDISQREPLLALLWQYIIRQRDSNLPRNLIGACAAIRKYIAIMPVSQMAHLATLLEAGHRTPMPIELEIEVAKMIYRNFEALPPNAPDPHPDLAERLFEMVEAYTNPRILLRSKYAACASLSIQAVVAMRSQLAARVLNVAVRCPYRWFTELVSDALDRLRERWLNNSPDAADWLDKLRESIPASA